MAAELDLRPKGIPNLEEIDEQKVDQLEEKKNEWIQKVMDQLLIFWKNLILTSYTRAVYVAIYNLGHECIKWYFFP